MSQKLDLSDYDFVIKFGLSIVGKNTLGDVVLLKRSYLKAHNVHCPHYWW